MKKTIKSKAVRHAVKLRAEIMPQSIDPAYVCRDVSTQDRATLRSGVYFVQLAPYMVFQLARFSRKDGTFNMHEQENVTPYRIFTCSEHDAKGTYIGKPVDFLTSGNDPAAYRPYI